MTNPSGKREWTAEEVRRDPCGSVGNHVIAEITERQAMKSKAIERDFGNYRGNISMKKCRYCGKELDSNLEFCSSECENSYRKIIEKDRHKIKYFISGIILGFLAMFYGVVSSRNCMIGSGIIVMGVTVVLLPFTTSETTALFGNKKARFIGRILGMILIAVGIWVGFI